MAADQAVVAFRRFIASTFYSDLGRRPGCGRVTVAAVAEWIATQQDRPRDDNREPKGTGSS
jgi:hypothetical protein